MLKIEVLLYAQGDPRHRTTVPISLDNQDLSALKYFLAKTNFLGTMEDMSAAGPIVVKVFGEDGREVTDLEEWYP